MYQGLYDNKLKPSRIYSRNSRLVRTQNVFNLELKEKKNHKIISIDKEEIVQLNIHS